MNQIFKPNILPSIVYEFIPAGIFLFYAFGMIFGLVALFLLSPLIALYIYLKMKNERYEIREDGVQIFSGIFAKSRGTIIYRQIQDINEQQGLIQRVFGLTNIEISTMASQRPRMVNLARSDAEEIKRIIMQNVKGNKEQLTQETIFPKENIFPIHPFKIALLIISLLALALLIIISILFIISSILHVPMLFFFSAFIPFAFIGLISLFLIGNAFVFSIGFKYFVDDEFFHTKFDFLNKNVTAMPLQKLRNITVKRSIFQRILGLSSVMIISGEGEKTYRKNNYENTDPGTTIPDLDRQNAVTLKEKLLKAMKIKDEKIIDLSEELPLDKARIIKAIIKPTIINAILLFLILIAINLIIKNIFQRENINNVYMITIYVFIALFVINTIIRIIYEIVYYRKYKYGESKELIELHAGAINTSTLTIPYSKVEHIFVDQDAFDRAFGIWDVHLATAGARRVQLHIDGLSKGNAEKLRNLFIKRTIYKK